MRRWSFVRRWCAGRTKAELEALAGDRIPLTPIKTIAEVVNDPHILARQMMVPVRVAGREVQAFGTPMKLNGEETKAAFLERSRKALLDLAQFARPK